ncbi:MAG TPA: hypothetical protein VES69_14900 [Pyrinomonadaceae bacterium]|nr:hypothetical protein [Pyrinomonadaceae bacterium]
MQTNSNTNRAATVTRFALGQTYITPGAEEALQIAGLTEIEFLRRHMFGNWGELSEDDLCENELSLKKDFRLLSVYRTGKGQMLFHFRL